MTVPVIVLEEALAEAREAVEQLEEARPGLAAAFIETLADAFSRLEKYPDIGVSAEFGNATRRWKLARFPYSIIYVVGGTRLVIVAIAHERRRPGYWMGRAR